MAAEAMQVASGRQDDGWRKGPWTSQEDELLVEHVRQHGEGRWNSVSKITGLKRSGKSCRLRWVNYLRPDLKRGKITPQEESIIVHLHTLWGNRWSTIARSLPGRTDNEIKNYWRTHFKKGKPSKNIERARARFLKQRREMQMMQQSQQQLLQQQHKQGKVDVVVEHLQAAAADDVGNAETTSSSTSSFPGHEELAIMQDVMDFMYPMSCVLHHYGGGAAGQISGSGGGGGSCCTTSEECGSSEEDGATWGSLWNLEDVADFDVDVVGAGACTLW